MLDEDSRFFLPEPIDIDDDREGRKPLRSTYPTLPERYPAQPPGYYWIPHFDVPAPRNMRLLREVPSVDYARLAAGDFDYAIEVLEDYPILDLDHYGILRVLQPLRTLRIEHFITTQALQVEPTLAADLTARIFFKVECTDGTIYRTSKRKPMM